MPRGFWAIGGLGLWLSSAWLCAQHPVAQGWPMTLALGTLLGAAACWQPVQACAVLLAAVPVLDARWQTGWTQVSELHIAAGWVLAGAWIRQALLPAAAPPMRRSMTWVWCTAWSAVMAGAWWQVPAGEALPQGWLFQSGGAQAPVLIWGWLQVLALAGVIAASPERQAWRRALSHGMAAGAVVVVSLLLLERCAQLPWWDLASSYRTTAWFWEMQHGGGALDIYLAASLPFLWWVHLVARRPVVWWASAIVMLMAAYAVVTTFSRGVLVTSVLSALWMLWSMPAAHPGRQRWFNLLLLGQVLALLVAGSFAVDRLSQSMVDVAGRWRHWQDMASLPDTPQRQWLGIGLGQAALAHHQRVPGGEWPGELHWQAASAAEPPHVSLSGPRTRHDLAGRFELARRWPSTLPPPQTLALTWRAPQALTLRLAWCEQHLLYEGNCKVRQVALPSSPGWRTDRWGWQTDTQGPATHAGWQDSTPKVLKWSVASVGGRIDVTRWAAWGASAQQPLIQGEVSPGSTGWLTLARGYYVPWHVDSLWLELAVERGWLGLLVWVAWTSCLFGVAVRRLGWPLAPGLVAWMGALGAVCLNGVLVSAFEFGRIAWLVQLLWVCASLWIMESANLPLKIPVTEREPCHRT